MSTYYRLEVLRGDGSLAKKVKGGVYIPWSGKYMLKLYNDTNIQSNVNIWLNGAPIGTWLIQPQTYVQTSQLTFTMPNPITVNTGAIMAIFKPIIKKISTNGLLPSVPITYIQQTSICQVGAPNDLMSKREILLQTKLIPTKPISAC